MAKIALAFALMPDSPMKTIVEWTKTAEDAGFDGVFLTGVIAVLLASLVSG